MTQHEVLESSALDGGTTRRGTSVGIAFCLLSVTTIQFGSALSLAPVIEFGANSATFLRFAIAALFLTALVRPRFGDFTPRRWRSAALPSVAMAVMTTCFFSAMPRLPTGRLVAIDFPRTLDGRDVQLGRAETALASGGARRRPVSRAGRLGGIPSRGGCSLGALRPPRCGGRRDVERSRAPHSLVPARALLRGGCRCRQSVSS